MHRSLLLTLVGWLLSCSPGFCATDLEEAFLKRVYTNAAGVRLPYRLLAPAALSPGQTLPVLVYLHGAIARGADNEEPLNWGPRLIRQTLERAKLPCLLVVPQCPKGVSWSSSSKGGEPDALSLTVELVGKVLPQEFAIDSRRRYLTGVSMGGIALWSYIARHPGFFAAAAPVCAAGETADATRATLPIPVWAFHSDDDHLIPVQSARDMVAAWTKAGGETKYTEYTGLKHGSWKKAYLEPELFPWLFSKTLSK